MTRERAIILVLIRPATWSRLGAMLTGAGFAIAPEYWQIISGIGLVGFPAIAFVLEEADRISKERGNGVDGSS